MRPISCPDWPPAPAAGRLYVACAGTFVGYRCAAGQAQGRRTCPKVHVRADLLEQAVVDQLAHVARVPAMRALIEAEAAALAGGEEPRLRAERGRAAAAARAADEKMARWADAFSGGLIARSQFVEHNVRLLEEREEARRALAAAERALAGTGQREAFAARLQRMLADFPAVWARLNPEERREALSLLLERLAVDRQGRELRLTLKLALLPEQAVTAPLPAAYRKSAYKEGAEALRPRQLALLHHLAQGRDMKEAAQAMGVSLGFAQSLRWQVRRRARAAASAMSCTPSRRRTNALLPTLPLGPVLGSGAAGLGDGGTPGPLPALLGEVLPLLASGATNRETARATGLSVPTVAGRRSRLVRLFGTSSIFEAAQRAREAGLFSR